MYSAGFNRYMEFTDGTLLINKKDFIPLLAMKEPVRYTPMGKERMIQLRNRLKILQIEKHAKNITNQPRFLLWHLLNPGLYEPLHTHQQFSCNPQLPF